jgi:hypothetical protein
MIMDSHTRIEKIVWIKPLINTSSSIEDFDEFVEELDVDPDLEIYKNIPRLKDLYIYEENLSSEDVLEYMNDIDMRGFLILAARPVMKYGDDKKSASYSWGRYHIAWLYTEEFVDLERVVNVWAEKMDKVDMLKEV